jgi:hypothetical protein
MGELLGLLGDGPRDLRMGVADADAEVHAEQVEIFLALLVPEILALAGLDDQRRLVRDEGALRGGIEPVAALDDGLRRPVDLRGRSQLRRSM